MDVWMHVMDTDKSRMCGHAMDTWTRVVNVWGHVVDMHHGLVGVCPGHMNACHGRVDVLQSRVTHMWTCVVDTWMHIVDTCRGHVLWPSVMELRTCRHVSRTYRHMSWPCGRMLWTRRCVDTCRGLADVWCGHVGTTRGVSGTRATEECCHAHACVAHSHTDAPATPSEGPPSAWWAPKRSGQSAALLRWPDQCWNPHVVGEPASPKLVGQPVCPDLCSWLANQYVLVSAAGWPINISRAGWPTSI